MSLDFPPNPGIGDRSPQPASGITYEWKGATWAVSAETAFFLRDAIFDGYQEWGEFSMISSGGVLQIPLDGRPRAITLTENVTLQEIKTTLPVLGNSKTTLVQNGVGNWTVDYPADWYWPNGKPGVMPPLPGDRMPLFISQSPDDTIEAWPQVTATPLSLDQVRDNAPAVWAGPVNPAIVMLFDATGRDWNNATDYQIQLFNDAVQQGGYNGGLYFPQGNPTAGNYSYATASGLTMNRTDGPWSWVMVFTYERLIYAFEFIGRFGPGTLARGGHDPNAPHFRLNGDNNYAFNNLLKTNAPYTAAIGMRYEPSEGFPVRGKRYSNGEVMPQGSIFMPDALSWDTLGADPNFNFPWAGRIHAFFRWDYEITEQEMLDITANPNILFVAP